MTTRSDAFYQQRCGHNGDKISTCPHLHVDSSPTDRVKKPGGGAEAGPGSTASRTQLRGHPEEVRSPCGLTHDDRLAAQVPPLLESIDALVRLPSEANPGAAPPPENCQSVETGWFFRMKAGISR